jgi:hypothetical protein
MDRDLRATLDADRTSVSFPEFAARFLQDTTRPFVAAYFRPATIKMTIKDPRAFRTSSAADTPWTPFRPYVFVHVDDVGHVRFHVRAICVRLLCSGCVWCGYLYSSLQLYVSHVQGCVRHVLHNMCAPGRAGIHCVTIAHQSVLWTESVLVDENTLRQHGYLSADDLTTFFAMVSLAASGVVKVPDAVFREAQETRFPAVYRDLDRGDRYYRSLLAVETAVHKHVPLGRVIVPQEGARLAVVVPYRPCDHQQREVHLKTFLEEMARGGGPFLSRVPGVATWRVFVVQQAPDGRKFNRGALLNAGASMAIDEGFNVLVLHDVDLVPTPAMAPWYTFNVEGGPVHLGAAWGKYTYPEYLGGVLAVHASHFMAANGYPNSFWGWGGEDDALRCRLGYVGLRPHIKRYGYTCA